MSATIRDIKAATGLSLATISKFLNGGNVLPENRVKLEAAIKDLHYEVNELARGLVTNRTRTIGVVVYAVENTFTGTLLKYVGESLRRSGYGMLICDSGNDEAVEARNIKFLINKKVDGIIIIPVSGRADFLEPAKNAGIPVVLMDRNINGEFDCIKTNNRTASKRAVEVLIDAGHSAIACIGSESEYTGKERLLGYKDAMEAADLAIRPEYIKRGTHSIEFGSTAMQELLELDAHARALSRVDGDDEPLHRERPHAHAHGEQSGARGATGDAEQHGQNRRVPERTGLHAGEQDARVDGDAQTEDAGDGQAELRKALIRDERQEV